MLIKIHFFFEPRRKSKMKSFKDWMVKSILVRAGRLQEIEKRMLYMEQVCKQHVCCKCAMYIESYVAYGSIITGLKCHKCHDIYCSSCDDLVIMYRTNLPEIYLCRNCAELPKCGCEKKHTHYVLCECGEIVADSHSIGNKHDVYNTRCNTCVAIINKWKN